MHYMKSTMEKATPRALHVAVLAFPFGSHSRPLLNLVQGIATEAPKVTFSFFCTADANASTFCELNKEKRLPNIKPYNVYDGLPEAYVPSGHPLEPVHLFIKAMPGNYRRALDEAVGDTGKKITCIITDAFLWFGAEVAEELHATWVPVWMAGPHALLTHVVTDLLRQKLGCNDDASGDQSLSFLPSFSAVKAKDLPEGILNGIEEPFAIMIHKAGQMLPRATTVAINSYDAILPPIVNHLKSKLRMLLNIGPLTLTTPQQIIPDEHGCLQWLDRHKNASVVYISFGTVITPPPHEIAALAEALEEGRFPFIWSFRGNHKKHLPEGFLARTRTQGKVAPWTPQGGILKHASIGVFVTHCGWNSILESIVGGVPMICRPFFADQRLNTRMLESEWGIGVEIENGVFTEKETLNVLEVTLTSEKGKMMRSNIVSLRESAMNAVQPCGSSTQNLRTLVELVTK